MASGTTNYFEPTTDQPPSELNVRRVQMGDRFSKILNCAERLSSAFGQMEEATEKT